MWKRVVAPVALVSVLWVGVSLVTTHFMQSMLQNQERMLAEDLSTMYAVGSMQEILVRLQATLLSAAQGRERQIAARIGALTAAFEEFLVLAENTCITPAEQEQSALIRERLGELSLRTNQWLTRRNEGASAEGTLSAAEIMRMTNDIAAPCRELLEINKRLVAEASQRNWQATNLMTRVRLGFMVSGPALGLLVGFWVARGFRRSIWQISVTLGDAAGELDHEVGQVELMASDDLPALHHQVQAIAGRIRQVMDQLQQARRETMRAERLAAVGELAAGVAHEIRNPLTAVKLLIQAAAKKYPGRPMPPGQLQVVEEEIARMENTVQGLLDFARPPRMRFISHDLRDTLRRSIHLVEGRARQQGVVITTRLPETPATVTADPQQLQHVLVNLLLNGLDAMPGGGLLELELERGGEGRWQIFVRDNGNGIPEPILARLFEPFVTGRDRGTGLGLAISRRIVREHGGMLSASNRAQGGAEFVVELAAGDRGEAADKRQLLASGAKGDSLAD